MFLDIVKELEEDIIEIIREKCNSISEDSTEEMNKRNKAGDLLVQIENLRKEGENYIEEVEIKDDSPLFLALEDPKLHPQKEIFELRLSTNAKTPNPFVKESKQNEN
jgi:hypothetical protein